MNHYLWKTPAYPHPPTVQLTYLIMALYSVIKLLYLLINNYNHKTINSSYDCYEGADYKTVGG